MYVARARGDNFSIIFLFSFFFSKIYDAMKITVERTGDLIIAFRYLLQNKQLFKKNLQTLRRIYIYTRSKKGIASLLYISLQLCKFCVWKYLDTLAYIHW